MSPTFVGWCYRCGDRVKDMGGSLRCCTCGLHFFTWPPNHAADEEYFGREALGVDTPWPRPDSTAAKPESSVPVGSGAATPTLTAEESKAVETAAYVAEWFDSPNAATLRRLLERLA